MSRWFRFYTEALNDPKVQRLPGEMFKGWINILSLTADNNGEIPAIEDVAFALRLTVPGALEIMDHLDNCGLLDLDEDTGNFKPHNWNGRQYKHDVSTERVKQFRKRRETVSETPTETPPETEQNTETDSEQKDIWAVAKATRPKAEEYFEEFWVVYPRREGANPKAPAKKLFLAAVKAGDDPQAIIDGARRCAERDKDKIGTPYIPQAVKWLRDKRWQDYATATNPTDIPPDIPPEQHADYRNGWRPGMPTSAEIRARNGQDHGHGEEDETPEGKGLLDEGGGPLRGFG